MRIGLRRFTPVCRSRCGAGGVPAPGGSYGTWDHSPCVWFCLCRPIETTNPTGTWDQQRRARSPGWAVSLPLGALAREGCGSLELVEIFQMRWVPRRFTPVCRSRCGAAWAGRGRAGTGSDRGLDSGAVYMVLLTQAQESDAPRPTPPPPHHTPLTLIGPEDRRVGMDWIAMDWIGLYWILFGLDLIGVRLHWIGLRMGWIGLDWSSFWSFGWFW